MVWTLMDGKEKRGSKVGEADSQKKEKKPGERTVKDIKKKEQT